MGKELIVRGEDVGGDWTLPAGQHCPQRGCGRPAGVIMRSELYRVRSSRGRSSLFRQAVRVPSSPAAGRVLQVCTPQLRQSPCSAANRVQSRLAILIPPRPSSFRGRSRLRTFSPRSRPRTILPPRPALCSADGHVQSWPAVSIYLSAYQSIFPPE